MERQKKQGRKKKKKEKRKERGRTTIDWDEKKCGLPSACREKNILKIPAKFRNDKGLPINCHDNVFIDLEFSDISYNFIIILQLCNLCCYAN